MVIETPLERFKREKGRSPKENDYCLCHQSLNCVPAEETAKIRKRRQDEANLKRLRERDDLRSKYASGKLFWYCADDSYGGVELRNEDELKMDHMDNGDAIVTIELGKYIDLTDGAKMVISIPASELGAMNEQAN